ncbi:myogenesis-regulating glycosidase-like [Haliotis rufescens]|uniref:myogenesis-regulating glycosidase-like n=1 Tax=Haliotis rufescens TaxID=6454 RepID=UPI00201F9A28|nr:myogenesis-regulating glycosidase-like [Haliotis rufescens]
MASHQQGRGRCAVAFALTAVVVMVVVVGVAVWEETRDQQEGTPFMSRAVYEIGDAEIHIQNTVHMNIRHNHVITGEIFMGYDWRTAGHKDCNTPEADVCLSWERDRKLEIYKTGNDKVTCYNVTWEAVNCVSQELKDCVELSRGHWFGGFEDYHQYWPMNEIQQEMAAYVATDSYAKKYGGVLERYFLSSTGLGIFIDSNIPLYLSFNDKSSNLMCMSAKFERSPYINIDNKPPRLSYTVCQANNIRVVHDYMSAKYIPRPEGVPDRRLFRSPIWSTWAMYKKDINQTQVLQLANDIVSNGFSHSQLEIDDEWTTLYGDMDFTTNKFPDARGMISQLNKDGFRVTVWVHPFFNIDSRAFNEAAALGYLVRAPERKLPALTSWWRGQLSGTLDVTNPYAVDWYLNKTNFLKDTYNISSFKFDAGEVAWLPFIYSVNRTYLNPNEYTRKWIDLAYRSDPDVRHQEVRVGAGSQNVPIFVRMMDKDSVWDNNNGLKTLIPCALTMGLIGYPFILPDMIGGNAYDNSSGLEARNYPDEELFIRWMQLNTFLPSLQFSVVPWVYNNETVVEITRYFAELHENYTSTIIKLAEDSVRTGEPIIRPIWWIAPQDEAALTIDSEYLLGNDLLVAPVVEKGATSRDIYLPEGTWFDELRKQQVEGGQWYRDYRAELHELPFFSRITT